MKTNKKINRGFDNSFKNWIRTMSENYVIQVFILCSTLLTLQLLNTEWCIVKWYEAVNSGTAETVAVSIGTLMPFAGTVIITCKGLKIWRDLKYGEDD